MKLEKPHRLRVVILGSLFLVLAGLVGVRLVVLQYSRHDHYTQRADGQHYKRVVLQPERGAVLDREGRPLAQSTGRMTVYIHPRYFREPEFDGNIDLIARTIAMETGMDADQVRSTLDGESPRSLARRIRPEEANRLMDVLDAQGIDGRGFWLHRESIRRYPRHLAAPVIGFCEMGPDGDNSGLAGLELVYNKELEGQKITARVKRSGISETLEPASYEDILAARGNSLVLTLDANIQESVEEILAAQIAEFEADCGGAIVMDARTGGILAMASYPTFDNNAFFEAERDAMRNRTLTDPLETGSVAKLFTAAMLLDKGYVTPDTMIDCEGGYAVIDGRRLRDSGNHNLGVVPFSEALRWSSNVGIVKAAMALENNEWYAALRDFGLGAPTGIDLPGEGAGILYPVERWTKFSRSSLPMGYEMALTPLQIVAGISAIVNGGSYHQPYIVEEIVDPKGHSVWRHDSAPVRQVIRPTTSAIMRDLMEDVVANGTGKPARVDGYRIGGKTGTTRKSNIFDRREYIASFAGAYPINSPQVVIYVYIDNPKGAYYASTVAAPAFREIVKATAIHLGIPPTDLDPYGGDVRYAANRRFSDSMQMRSLQADVMSGRMPNLMGMSVAQSRASLPAGARQVRFLGTGMVSDQFPPAGEPLGTDDEIVLHFSPVASIEAEMASFEAAYNRADIGGTR